MFNGSSKRVVVIRDIHSNLIEEAILILKSDTEPAKDKSDVQKNRKRNNDFLVKEAELIIDNYVRENKVSLINNVRQPQKKINPPKNKKLVGLAINSVLIGSIALLIFLISKMF
jgi:hypothetical protein